MSILSDLQAENATLRELVAAATPQLAELNGLRMECASLRDALEEAVDVIEAMQPAIAQAMAAASHVLRHLRPVAMTGRHPSIDPSLIYDHGVQTYADIIDAIQSASEPPCAPCSSAN